MKSKSTLWIVLTIFLMIIVGIIIFCSFKTGTAPEQGQTAAIEPTPTHELIYDGTNAIDETEPFVVYNGTIYRDLMRIYSNSKQILGEYIGRTKPFEIDKVYYTDNTENMMAKNMFDLYQVKHCGKNVLGGFFAPENSTRIFQRTFKSGEITPGTTYEECLLGESGYNLRKRYDSEGKIRLLKEKKSAVIDSDQKLFESILSSKAEIFENRNSTPDDSEFIYVSLPMTDGTEYCFGLYKTGYLGIRFTEDYVYFKIDETITEKLFRKFS